MRNLLIKLILGQWCVWIRHPPPVVISPIFLVNIVELLFCPKLHPHYHQPKWPKSNNVKVARLLKHIFFVLACFLIMHITSYHHMNGEKWGWNHNWKNRMRTKPHAFKPEKIPHLNVKNKLFNQWWAIRSPVIVTSIPFYSRKWFFSYCFMKTFVEYL